MSTQVCLPAAMFLSWLRFHSMQNYQLKSLNSKVRLRVEIYKKASTGVLSHLTSGIVFPAGALVGRALCALCAVLEYMQSRTDLFVYLPILLLLIHSRIYWIKLSIIILILFVFCIFVYFRALADPLRLKKTKTTLRKFCSLYTDVFRLKWNIFGDIYRPMVNQTAFLA